VGTPAHNVNANVPVGTYIDFASSRSAPGGEFAQQRTVTDEIRVAGKVFGDKLDYQGGVYFEESTPLGPAGAISATFSHCSSYAPVLCNNPLGAASVARTNVQNKYRNVGVYFQGVYALTDQLKLTGGIRYTWDRVKNSNTQINYAIPIGSGFSAPTGYSCTLFVGTLPDCTVARQAHFHAPTWTLGLDYRANENLLLYGKYSRGYRSGNINVALPPQLSFVQPEKVDSYEVGFKKSFGGSIRGTFNVSAFYNDFRNQILRINFNRISANTAIAAATNAGKSRIYGLEVESSISPFDGFVVDANYAYLNGKIKKIIFPELPAGSDLAPVGGFLPGDPLVFTPKNKFTLTGTYTLPLDDSLGRVAVGATVAYTDNQLSNAVYRLNAAGQFCTVVVAGCKVTGPSILPSYTLLNLNLDWTSIGGHPIDLSLFANNVTGKKYLTYSQVFFTTGFNSRQLGAPRTYGARLKYHF
jgi:iron complex outermembrane receptor protein